MISTVTFFPISCDKFRFLRIGVLLPGPRRAAAAPVAGPRLPLPVEHLAGHAGGPAARRPAAARLLGLARCTVNLPFLSRLIGIRRRKDVAVVHGVR